MLFLRSLLLTIVIFPLAAANAASATASIRVTILPVEGTQAQQAIHVVPSQLELHQHDYGKISVSNHSGQHNKVNVDVSPSAINGCRLVYTPKSVVINNGQTQIFRVFYVTENNSSCHARFDLQIRYGGDNAKTIVVNCK